MWTDRRSLSHYDIYAEFIDYNGDILWGDQGFSGTPGIPGFDIFIVIGLTGLIAILISKKLNILKMKVI